MAQATRRQIRGISLIETCMGSLLVAVLLSQAVPALQQLQQRQRLQGIAQTLMTDLQQSQRDPVPLQPPPWRQLLCDPHRQVG